MKSCSFSIVSRFQRNDSFNFVFRWWFHRIRLFLIRNYFSVRKYCLKIKEESILKIQFRINRYNWDAFFVFLNSVLIQKHNDMDVKKKTIIANHIFQLYDYDVRKRSFVRKKNCKEYHLNLWISFSWITNYFKMIIWLWSFFNFLTMTNEKKIRAQLHSSFDSGSYFREFIFKF